MSNYKEQLKIQEAMSGTRSTKKTQEDQKILIGTKSLRDLKCAFHNPFWSRITSLFIDHPDWMSCPYEVKHQYIELFIWRSRENKHNEVKTVRWLGILIWICLYCYTLIFKTALQILQKVGYQNIYLINLFFELERCTHPFPKTNSY